MKQSIFITGINGFVGTATAKHFLDQGFHVVGLVRDLNYKSDNTTLDRCSIVKGDILDKELMRSVLSKYEVDYVLHLAAQPIVRICDSDPYTAYMTNIVGTLNLLEGIRTLKTKPKKVIVMTSDKAYGPAPLPYTEDTELVVADSYCTSKACQDLVSRSYAMTYDLPVLVVRAGNIYGPGDLNFSRLIPSNTIRLLKGESPILYTGSAEYVREFIYIDDLITSYDILLKEGKASEAYNIGGTTPNRILDVVTLMRDKIKKDIPIKLLEKEFYEIPAQYLNGDKLKALGWKSKVDLSEGLDKTIAWYKGKL